MGDKKRGRPCKIDSKTHIVSVRLADDEYERIENICAKTGDIVSEILRKSVIIYSDLL